MMMMMYRLEQSELQPAALSQEHYNKATSPPITKLRSNGHSCDNQVLSTLQFTALSFLNICLLYDRHLLLEMFVSCYKYITFFHDLLSSRWQRHNCEKFEPYTRNSCHPQKAKTQENNSTRSWNINIYKVMYVQLSFVTLL